MGFMTEVSILNDRWEEVRKNAPAFVEQLYEASIRGTNDVYGKYIIGQTTVAQTHHADDLRVYFSARNSFFDAYPENSMPVDRLKGHLKYLKEMKEYIKISEQAIKLRIAKGESK
jgi:hypothetical protein